VLEAIPSDLTTEAIQAEFPDCKKVARFNPRRCYVYFKTIEDGFAAFERLESESVCGFKLTARFRKTNSKKALKRKRKESTKSDANSTTNSDEEKVAVDEPSIDTDDSSDAEDVKSDD
jgi:hypothetical protein